MSNITPPPMPEAPLHCIKNMETGFMTRIGAYKNAVTARGALRARGKSPDRFDAVPVYTAEQLAARDAQWLEKVGPLAEAVEAAFACGMIPTTSANEGGAAKHSQQVRVADNLRAALAAITKD